MHDFEIRQEVGLNAPRQRVWRALTEEIGTWWAYRSGPEHATVSLDPRLGGHFAEQWGSGDGAIWGVVTRISAPERLRFVGHLGMQGPGRNDCTFVLEARGDSTLLRLTHCGYGHDDPMVEQNYRVGWAGLLHRYLKAWVEEGKPHRELDRPTSEPAPYSTPWDRHQRASVPATYRQAPMPVMRGLELPIEWLL